MLFRSDMDEYIRISRYAREIYEDYTDQVEPFGLDESWLDVTGSVGLYGSPMTIARVISNRIKFELGITASIGVADNKITAKLGSDYKKPDAITHIGRDNCKEIVYPLPVEDLLYVGPATSKKLRSVPRQGRRPAAGRLRSGLLLPGLRHLPGEGRETGPGLLRRGK